MGKIDSGEWPVGHVIPPEVEMAKQMSVSRATVRQAILELVTEGFLRRVQGRGTVVTKPKVEPIAALASFTENMKAMGVRPSHKVLSVAWTYPSRKIAEFFRLDPVREEKVLCIRRLMLADDEPISLQAAYLPPYLVHGHEEVFSMTRLELHSLYALIEQELGVAIWRADETLDVSIARKGEEAELLEISAGHPIMVIRRCTFDRDDRPIEYVKHLFRPDRYRYRISLYRTIRDGGRNVQP